MSAISPVRRNEVNETLTCWDGVSESSLAGALSLRVTECMEVALIDGNQYNQLSFRPRAAGCLRLAVTTRSAYRHKIVRVFVAALAMRTELSRSLRERIRTAVQEAVINAMLHGNLAMSSEGFSGLESMAASHEIIEGLLTSPQIARSLIRVEAVWNSAILNVLVHDSGTGFKRKKMPLSEERHAATDAKSGRGLAILEAFCDRVAVLRGGTTIKLGFRL